MYYVKDVFKQHWIEIHAFFKKAELLMTLQIVVEKYFAKTL